MATREQIMEALFAVAKNSGDFLTASRRLTNPEGMDPALSPALFLVEQEDPYERKAGGYNQLPKREMTALILIYNDVGTDQNAIPATPINNALDNLDVLFKPDDTARNTFTLGGLVESCTIDGTIKRASGDVTGKALATVPVRILIP